MLNTLPRLAFRYTLELTLPVLMIAASGDYDEYPSSPYMEAYYVQQWPNGKITAEKRVMSKSLFYYNETTYDQLPEIGKEMLWAAVLSGEYDG